MNYMAYEPYLNQAIIKTNNNLNFQIIIIII